MRLRKTLGVIVLTGTVAFGVAQTQTAAHQDDPDAAAKIESAMSAAPPAVSEEATILDYTMDDAGHFVVLREGSNGWSCFPDGSGSPGNDPMCLDAMWMDWMNALMTSTEPSTTAPGLAYMLQGGSDASNADPFAAEPASGEDWVNSPAHIMVLMPAELDQSVFSTDHDSGRPYIMYAGTPFEHIMMPVAVMDHEG